MSILPFPYCSPSRLLEMKGIALQIYVIYADSSKKIDVSFNFGIAFNIKVMRMPRNISVSSIGIEWAIFKKTGRKCIEVRK